VPITDKAPPTARDSLPYPLTFFLTALQRRRVLRALRRLHRQRSTALLMALRSQSTASTRLPRVLRGIEEPGRPTAVAPTRAESRS